MSRDSIKMMSHMSKCVSHPPIPSNRYAEGIFAIGIIKKVTGEKRQGGGIHPPGRPRVDRSGNILIYKYVGINHEMVKVKLETYYIQGCYTYDRTKFKDFFQDFPGP